MLLTPTSPRNDWQKNHEALRFGTHSLAPKPDNWDESRSWSEYLCVEITQRQADILHSATQRIHDMCMETVEGMIKSGDYPALLGLNEPTIRLIERSWRRGDPSISGRFDLSFDGQSAPKLIEYNADNPGLLMEAAVLQSQWSYDKGGLPQYNGVYAGLVDAWTNAKSNIPSGVLYMTTNFDVADAVQVLNVHVMAASNDAGIPSIGIDIRDIAWDNTKRKFYNPHDNAEIDTILKVNDWSGMVEDGYGVHLTAPDEPLRVIEPAYRMLISNKAFLVVLAEKYPNHENLLPASFSARDFANSKTVKKPIWGSNGEGVKILPYGPSLASDTMSLTDVYQLYAPLPQQNGHSILTQTWVTGGKATGVGFSIERSEMVSSQSRFAPHYIKG